MTNIIDVTYPYVYDLYYRVRHARLENTVYRIDFWDWVKAGVAFNIRGQDPSRKIAYFVELHEQIQSGDFMRYRYALQLAAQRFYEDLFLLYQDHLVAQLKIAQRQDQITLDPDELILLPSFDSTPGISDVLDVVHVEAMRYKSLHLDELQHKMATIYATEGSAVFQFMALYFDYGIKTTDPGVILEVQ